MSMDVECYPLDKVPEMLAKDGTGIIYKIQNLLDGKSYIGRTVSFRERMINHRRQIKDTDISRAIRFFGSENFVVSILWKDIPVSELGDYEEEEIFLHDTYDSGYNMVDICDSRKTPGVRAKISKSKKGKPRSPATRKKISETLKNNGTSSFKGKPAWNKGIKLSPETRHKMSAAKKGKRYPNNSRKKSQEERDRISIVLKGRKFSKETLQKMSASQLKRFEEERRINNGKRILNKRGVQF